MRRRVFALLPGAWLLVACAGQPQAPPQPIYSVWLHDDYYWYDDDFWIWIDDNPDCCSNPDDLRDALKRWWEGLPPDQQDKVRQRVADWLEEHGLQPENVTEVRELVLETVQDRWDALTPEERRAWLDGRSDRAKARLAQRSGEPRRIAHQHVVHAPKRRPRLEAPRMRVLHRPFRPRSQ